MYAAKETEKVAKSIQKIKVKEEKEKKKSKEKNLVVLSYIALGPFFFLVYYYYGDTEYLYDKNLFSLFVIP